MSLFSTSSDKAGFRLQYMEIYNWGIFDQDVFRISPKGNNSLLTGANGSGKSTLMDALLTLLVPLQKDRFYNQSSGVEKKGDRTEKTYVLGHYGNIQEGATSTSTQKLRPLNTYSVLLACFSNTDQKTITLFQVIWFSGEELKKQFGIAHTPLEITKDFYPFDAKGRWKTRLEHTYNQNQQKRKIEFIDGPTRYASKILNLFGMRSENALRLFNQVAGVKDLDNLDKFIRTTMLEEHTDENNKKAEDLFIEIRNVFVDLMNAKTNIQKAKEQIKQLTPIDEIANTLEKINNELQDLKQAKELSVYWFAKRIVELGKKESQKYTEQLKGLEVDVKILNEKQNQLRDERDNLNIAIKSDEIGNQITNLEKEIKQLEDDRKKSKSKLDEYNKIAQSIGLNTNPNKETFTENKETAAALKLSTQHKIDQENKTLYSLETKNADINKEREGLIETIKTLHENKNNIAGRDAQIRDEIIAHIGVKKDEIPFVGELIKVSDEQKEWASSIEKILHNFALQLIVPKKYYSQVNQYVNDNNLKGRVRYNKFEKQEYLKEFQQKSISENSLLKKIEIKPNTKYNDWIDDHLSKQFNFACVENLEEFEKHPEIAVTKNGLVKFKNGRHEKDDRPHISKRENYVLGWDNKEKIASLKEKNRNLKQQQIENTEAISTSKEQIRISTEYQEQCIQFSNYQNYDEINWQIYAQQIQEKQEKKKALEKTNDKVKTLREQLEKVKAQLQQTNKDIDTNKQQTWELKENQKTIDKEVGTNEGIITSLENIDISAFESQNPQLLTLEYANLQQGSNDFQQENSENSSNLTTKKNKNENEVKDKIRKFKNPPDAIRGKFKDWSSDVHALPEETNLDSISEYQVFLKKLMDEDLPKFETKFKKLLQDTVTNNIGEFGQFFKNWSVSIKKHITDLNTSLKNIDFNNDPQTYIQLVVSDKKNEKISEFKRLLEKSFPNITEINASIDGRENHFTSNIEPFFKHLELETWRKEVMDVRAWFTYKAEEFRRETNQKLKTYESMGHLSGGEKAQLTYTILGAAITYQFGLTNKEPSNSFRFIAIDEAFRSQDAEKAKYLINLCKQLHLQLLVVTPSDNIHIVEKDISFVHYVERKEGRESQLYNMPLERFKKEQSKFINND